MLIHVKGRLMPCCGCVALPFLTWEEEWHYGACSFAVSLHMWVKCAAMSAREPGRCSSGLSRQAGLLAASCKVHGVYGTSCFLTPAALLLRVLFSHALQG